MIRGPGCLPSWPAPLGSLRLLNWYILTLKGKAATLGLQSKNQAGTLFTTNGVQCGLLVWTEKSQAHQKTSILVCVWNSDQECDSYCFSEFLIFGIQKMTRETAVFLMEPLSITQCLLKLLQTSQDQFPLCFAVIGLFV